MSGSNSHGASLRAPFFYGWVVVAIAFVTMAITISARSSFSLLYPQILDEFGWDRGLTAGAFSIGFLASTALLPFVAWLMRVGGPQLVMPAGALLITAGYALAPSMENPLHLYVTMGFLVVTGSMAASYIAHSMFLPAWFLRNRGLAVGLAFAGVGVGMAVLMPAMQWAIDTHGWRWACYASAIVVAATVIPLNLFFQRGDPASMGLEPDGGARLDKDGKAETPPEVIVNTVWAAKDWTLGMAVRTSRFWFFGLMMFGGLFAWYATLAHQTQFLLDQGFDTGFSAWALGLVPLFGVAGQIVLGWLSDRIGRERAWSMATSGFVASSLIFVLIARSPEGWPWMVPAVYAMIVVQGLLGHGMAAIFGAAIAEVFQGRDFFKILATISLMGNVGAALGAWALGALYDFYGNYELGFMLSAAAALASVLAIWGARPSAIRLVAGQARRRLATSGNADASA